MHVHASDSELTRKGSAKFFVKEDGTSVLQNKGSLTDKDVKKISEYIKDNYMEMYEEWQKYSENGFYRG